MRRHTWWMVLTVGAAAFAGCMNAGDESTDDLNGTNGMNGTDGTDGTNGMGDDAMGMGEGDAMVTQLAMAPIDELPEGPLAWIGFQLPTAEGAGGSASHVHGPAFAYAPDEDVRLVVDGEARTIPRGGAAFVMADVEHSHPDGGWEIRLAPSGTEAPPGAQRMFESDPLEGVPDAPVDVRFVHVALPPGSMTSVHEHPGPEYVWVSEGAIQHQSGQDGTIELGQGEDHSLPPYTAVQKRNPGEADAAFLSFFVVDPDEPFVIESSFG